MSGKGACRTSVDSNVAPDVAPKVARNVVANDANEVGEIRTRNLGGELRGGGKLGIKTKGDFRTLVVDSYAERVESGIHLGIIRLLCSGWEVLRGGDRGG